MYIDGRNINSSSSGIMGEVINDEEATATLKGLLGIGVVKSASASDESPHAVVPSSSGNDIEAPMTTIGGSGNVPKQQSAEETSSTAVDASPEPQQQQGKKKKKPRKNKKKNPSPVNNMNSGNNGGQQQESSHQDGAAESSADEGKPAQPSATKKKNKKKRGGKDEANGSNTAAPPQHPFPREEENFAWSAFQSSPDASKLPLPTFAAPQPSLEFKMMASLKLDESKFDEINKKLLSPEQQQETSASVPSTPNPDKPEAPVPLDQLPHVEESRPDSALTPVKDKPSSSSEGKVESSVVLGGDRKGVNIVNPPSQVSFPEAAQVHPSQEPSVTTVVLAEEPAAPPNAPEELTVSKTGVNLAALASSPPSAPAPTSRQVEANPLNLQQQPPPRNMLPFPQQQNYVPYGMGPYRGPQQQQQQIQQQQIQQHAHHQHPPLPHGYGPTMPPPGYVTVQVRVPPALMHGRRMMVASPAGYPVEIVVPQGIPPGAVIPVHVPAAHPPALMHPHMLAHMPYGGASGQYYHHHHLHHPGGGPPAPH